jgi:chitosanase
MLTNRQKQTIQAIVNVFETGKPAGDYASVTVLPDDPGHLTYGRSQATLSSGNLWRLVRDYCAAAGGAVADDLRPFLKRLEACDTSLDTDARLRALLREAGADPAMRRAQDVLFDRSFWSPSLRAAQAFRFETALAVAVVYDSFIHGAWIRMRNATTAHVGPPAAAPAAKLAAAGERAWISAYIAVRRDWLAAHSNPLLRHAVYRMYTFAALVQANNWDLDLPLEAHGVRLDEHAFAGGVEAQDAQHVGAPPVNV